MKRGILVLLLVAGVLLVARTSNGGHAFRHRTTSLLQSCRYSGATAPARSGACDTRGGAHRKGCGLGPRRLESSCFVRHSTTVGWPPRLTDQETKVLRLLSAGLTNAEIGTALFISPKTASVHVTHALRKLGAVN